MGIKIQKRQKTMLEWLPKIINKPITMEQFNTDYLEQLEHASNFPVKAVKYCYFCGASRPEFTVASKHLSYMLKRCKKFDGRTNHITVHICEDCFLKIFDKEQNNGKVEMDK